MKRLFAYSREHPRMGWLTALLLAAIGAAMFALLFLVWQTIEAERSERTQVKLTNQVLIALRDVGRTALRGETGQRGYLLTLDRRYLAPYETGREQLEPAVANLRTLIGDKVTPRQAELIEEIDALAHAKFDEMDESVALVASGRLLDARRGVLSDEGIEVMERLQRAIAEMEGIELEILAEATRETARAEARVLPMLAALLFLLVLAAIVGFMLATRAARAEAEAAQALALAEAHDRADLLARELNHRVKNLFAVILAIVRMGGKEDPAARPASERMADRIGALLTAHEVSQGTLDKPVASLEALVETTLRPYRSKDFTADIGGPPVMIPAKRATPLGLVLHELTTNAVKYGCWRDAGQLDVHWTVDDGAVRLEWREHCTFDEVPSGNTGFGTRLMEAASRQLHGSIERTIDTTGARVVIAFPLDIEG